MALEKKPLFQERPSIMHCGFQPIHNLRDGKSVCVLSASEFPNEQRNELLWIPVLQFGNTGLSLQKKKKVVNLRETSYIDLLGSWVKMCRNFKHLKTPIRANSKHGEIAFIMKQCLVL